MKGQLNIKRNLNIKSNLNVKNLNIKISRFSDDIRFLPNPTIGCSDAVRLAKLLEQGKGVRPLYARQLPLAMRLEDAPQEPIIHRMGIERLQRLGAIEREKLRPNQQTTGRRHPRRYFELNRETAVFGFQQKGAYGA